MFVILITYSYIRNNKRKEETDLWWFHEVLRTKGAFEAALWEINKRDQQSHHPNFHQYVCRHTMQYISWKIDVSNEVIKKNAKEPPFGQAWPGHLFLLAARGKVVRRAAFQSKSWRKRSAHCLLTNTRESSPVRDREANENFNKEMIWEKKKMLLWFIANQTMDGWWFVLCTVHTPFPPFIFAF